MVSEAQDEFYNVGTGKRTSLRELAEMLLKLTGTNSTVQYKERSQATFVKNRIGCPLKAAQQIDFTSKVSLEKGLEALIHWRQQHIDQVENRKRAAGLK